MPASVDEDKSRFSSGHCWIVGVLIAGRNLCLERDEDMKRREESARTEESASRVCVLQET